MGDVMRLVIAWRRWFLDHGSPPEAALRALVAVRQPFAHDQAQLAGAVTVQAHGCDTARR